MDAQNITFFLEKFEGGIIQMIHRLRTIVKKNLPDLTETVDVPAKMIAYSYGTRYTDMICCIFPSKKGAKLSFYNGVNLPDPENILEGSAKTTRYLNYKTAGNISEKVIEDFLKHALHMYRKRI